MSTTHRAPPIAIAVVARIGAKEFARFSVDMPEPCEHVPSIPFEPPDSGTGFDALDEIPRPQLMTIEAQGTAPRSLTRSVPSSSSTDLMGSSSRRDHATLQTLR